MLTREQVEALSKSIHVDAVVGGTYEGQPAIVLIIPDLITMSRTCLALYDRWEALRAWGESSTRAMIPTSLQIAAYAVLAKMRELEGKP